MKLQFQRSLGGTRIFNSDGGFDGITVYLVGTINFGLAPNHRITQRGPFQEGDSDIDFRLDPRVLSLPIVAPASSIEESLAVRSKLLKIFMPGTDKASVRMNWSYDGDSYERSIDVVVVGGLSFDTDSKDFNVRSVVQLRAADPTWYSTFGAYITISENIFGTPTPYPKPYPVPYGATAINRITSITYDGSWPSFPVIQATGPVTNLTMVDTLGNILNFVEPILAGDTWTIDLSYGKKTIVDQNGVNKFAALSIDSNIVSWGLYPEPPVANGINTISVSGTDTTNATGITMVYYARYIGV
jgi:hypothetical protein